MTDMTAREYAASLGLAKLGRGRMSPAAKAAIAKAESQGITFKLSNSAVYMAELAQRRANGEVIRRGRRPSATTTPKAVTAKKPRGKRVLTSEHIAAMQAGRNKAKQEAAGEILPLDASEKGRSYSEEWYQKTFAVGNFVCSRDGQTYQVLSQKDADGFTHFLDIDGRKWKAKVNASWGVRKGFPERKDYTPNNAK